MAAFLIFHYYYAGSSFQPILAPWQRLLADVNFLAAGTKSLPDRLLTDQKSG